MYAVIETGGKQERVAVGEKLKITKLAVEPGAAVEFDKVLMVAADDALQVGQPYVQTAKVSAKVLAHGRDKKVEIVKFKRRKHHMKRQGHRQDFTQIEITDIKSA